MSTLKKYLFVVNPIAGGVDKTEMVAAVDAFAAGLNIVIITYETTGEDDESRIKNLYAEHRPERIIVAGGDGTIKLVAEALEQKNVVFGIIPAGSANGLSVDLNFPDALDEVLAIAFHNDYMELDMVSINNRKSLHLSDIGLNAELIKNYENSRIRGKIGYALQALSTLTDDEVSFHVTVEANGEVVEAETKMVVIANSQKYGTGVTINPHGKMDDGKFEIVVIKSLTLGVFGKIISGNMPLDTGDVEIISADRATITTDIPVHFQVDGEYYGEESRLEVKILPKQMKLAIPNP
ncbi:MAG TPA: diacylglycerol kinase family protein [Flavobacterium sp.]|jgi:YegS/Rv2252/BmrU family lipid kinase